VADTPITGGTFKLWIGQDLLKVNVQNKWTDQIPWDINDYQLQDGINQLLPKCESRVWVQNRPLDGRAYYFSCGGVVQHIPKIAVF
jgi:hypothetical protein